MELTAGEHEVTILFGSDGPNVYGLKFATEGVDMTAEGGLVDLADTRTIADMQVTKEYAVQFNMTVPFDYITLSCPSYSNNKGSLRFELFKWNENYEKTISGKALSTKDFVDFEDNATLTVTFGKTMTPGEYLLRITNVSQDPAEQVGLWMSNDSPEGVRSYLNGTVIPNAPFAKVHYVGTTDTPLGLLSANLTETPVYEEVTESQKDLSGYGLPDTGRYLGATVLPDTWVFTDGLGRVSHQRRVGDPREGKTLAMFYWNWHATFGKSRTAFNVQEFIDKQTADGIPLSDYIYDYDYPGWLAKDNSIQYFWDEPIYGYYRSDDEWVIRKQAELLTAAGVDVIFTDNSNASLTWSDSYPIIYKTWTKALGDGVNTPKISNLMPFRAGEDTRTQLVEMYNSIYHDGKYRFLWFYWEGKPFIMARAGAVAVALSKKKEF